MEAHPAQAENLPDASAVGRLMGAKMALDLILSEMNRSKPTKQRREHIRRVLSGVVADCEVVRWALK